jgi:hypothetical protein
MIDSLNILTMNSHLMFRCRYSFSGNVLLIISVFEQNFRTSNVKNTQKYCLTMSASEIHKFDIYAVVAVADTAAK